MKGTIIVLLLSFISFNTWASPYSKGEADEKTAKKAKKIELVYGNGYNFEDDHIEIDINDFSVTIFIDKYNGGESVSWTFNKSTISRENSFGKISLTGVCYHNNTKEHMRLCLEPIERHKTYPNSNYKDIYHTSQFRLYRRSDSYSSHIIDKEINSIRFFTKDDEYYTTSSPQKMHDLFWIWINENFKTIKEWPWK